MADVQLMVCGRPYAVHCADGEEGRLMRLAATVDAKARSVGGGTEARQLLFAALLLADEADDKDARIAELEAREAAATARVRELESAAPGAAAPALGPPPGMTRALEQIADRIEALAARVAPEG